MHDSGERAAVVEGDEPAILRPAAQLDAIVELHDWPETGSDDEDGSGESSPSDVDDVDVRATSSCSTLRPHAPLRTATASVSSDRGRRTNRRV